MILVISTVARHVYLFSGGADFSSKIYHFEYKTWVHLTMASLVKRCEVRDERVAILTGSGSDSIVTLWTWNGRVVNFALTYDIPVSREHKTLPMLHLHPIHPDIVWVTWSEPSG